MWHNNFILIGRFCLFAYICYISQVSVYLNTDFAILMFASSAARYQNELAGVDAEQLAERFYHQALSVMPHVGE